MVWRLVRVLLLVVLGLALVGLLSPIPSDESESGETVTCIAIRDGWSSPPPAPTLPQLEAWTNRVIKGAYAIEPGNLEPSSVSRADSDLIGRYLDWKNSAGQCGRQAHDLLRVASEVFVACVLVLSVSE